MELLPLYLSAVVLGTAHALEPDHMAAVTTFVVRRPRPIQAAVFGARWALGHGTAILIVGVALLIVGQAVPDSWTSILERLVGVAMIGLGLWTVATAPALHAHEHIHADGTRHSHIHSHAIAQDHQHGHAVTAVGLLHGLAGTGSAVALIPLISLRTPQQGALYLFLFGIGTAAGMAAYAFLAGFLARRISDFSVRLARAVTLAAGVFAIGVGVFWLLH